MQYCLLRAGERKCKVSRQENTVDKLSCHFCGFYAVGRNFFDFIPAMRRPPFLIDFTTVLSTSQCIEAPTFLFYSFILCWYIHFKRLLRSLPLLSCRAEWAHCCLTLFLVEEEKGKKKKKMPKKRNTRPLWPQTHENSAASRQRRASKIKINKGDERRHERRLSGCRNAGARDLRGEEDIEHWRKGGKTSFQVVSQIGQTRNSANCLKKWGGERNWGQRALAP